MARILKDDLIRGICFECGKKVENDVLCKDCIEKLREKLFGFKFDGNWIEDLLWCPTQLYRKFQYDGNNYVLYLRWRSADPFQCYLLLTDSGNKSKPIIHDPIVAWSEDLFERFKMYVTSKDNIDDIELIAESLVRTLAESRFVGINWNHFVYLSFKDSIKSSVAELFAPIDFFVKLKKEKSLIHELYYKALEKDKFYKMSSIENYEYVSYFNERYILDNKSTFRIELKPIISKQSDKIKDWEIIVEEV